MTLPMRKTMNNQPTEKRTDSQDLDITEIFFTIQGDGPFSGHRAVFIRLAGCNLQCPACDTNYTHGRYMISVDEIIDHVNHRADGNVELVVITGGEPFRQDILKLCIGLRNCGYAIQIETNGTFPPPEGLPEDIKIVCSPKTTRINSRMRPRVTSFKYLIDDYTNKDGLPYRVLGNKTQMVARPSGDSEIYIQAADYDDIVMNRRNQATAIKSCLDHGYIFQVQIHKLIGLK